MRIERQHQFTIFWLIDFWMEGCIYTIRLWTHFPHYIPHFWRDYLGLVNQRNLFKNSQQCRRCMRKQGVATRLEQAFSEWLPESVVSSECCKTKDHRSPSQTRIYPLCKKISSEKWKILSLNFESVSFFLFPFEKTVMLGVLAKD